MFESSINKYFSLSGDSNNEKPTKDENVIIEEGKKQSKKEKNDKTIRNTIAVPNFRRMPPGAEELTWQSKKVVEILHAGRSLKQRQVTDKCG